MGDFCLAPALLTTLVLHEAFLCGVMMVFSTVFFNEALPLMSPTVNYMNPQGFLPTYLPAPPASRFQLSLLCSQDPALLSPLRLDSPASGLLLGAARCPWRGEQLCYGRIHAPSTMSQGKAQMQIRSSNPTCQLASCFKTILRPISPSLKNNSRQECCRLEAGSLWLMLEAPRVRFWGRISVIYFAETAAHTCLGKWKAAIHHGSSGSVHKIRKKLISTCPP